MKDKVHELVILRKEDLIPSRFANGKVSIDDIDLCDFHDIYRNDHIKKASMIIYIHSPKKWKVLRCRFKQPKSITWIDTI